MTAIATITMRAAVMTQALATMGADPIWDAKLAAYLRAEALQFADCEFGAYYEASEIHTREEHRIGNVYGKNTATNERANAEVAAALAAFQPAEQAWYDNFTTPHWEAARELAKTPAPTLAAALFKVHVIHADEIWNDSGFDLNVMAIIEADMARLAGEA